MFQLIEFAIRGVLLGVIYGVVALPIALLFVTTDSVDMAVGGYAVLAAATVITVGGPLGIALAVLVGVLASAVTGVVALTINKPGAGDPMTGVLASYGLATFLESFVLTSHGPDPMFNQSFEVWWNVGGMRIDPQMAINVAVALLSLAALAFLLFRTSYGRSMRASAVNPLGATLAGVPVWRVWFSTYLLGGALAATAGILIVKTTGIAYDNGLPLTLSSFAAAVLFGLQGPSRAFFGGLVMGVIEALSSAYLPGAWGSGVPLLFIFVVLASGRASKQSLVGARA
ncbi:MAG TPA: branched-chain amino acid ABC transporter permease [Devosiaceae bacterium]|jgi:branched-chain amino acid transport system permease protein